MISRNRGTTKTSRTTTKKMIAKVTMVVKLIITRKVMIDSYHYYSQSKIKKDERFSYNIAGILWY